MKTFFIAKNDHITEESNEKLKITDENTIKTILGKAQLLNVDPSKYTVFDESELYRNNKFFKEFIDAIINVHFPTHWDITQAINVYTPKKDIIYNEKSTVYVHQWSDISINDTIHSLRFIYEDIGDKYENQRVLILFHKKR